MGAKKLTEEFFLKFSPVEQLHSDEGHQFESQLMVVVCNRPGETTVERQGKTSVPMHTIGHKKACFTVVLPAMTNCKKLKLFVRLKGFCAVPELARFHGVVIALTHNG